MAVGCYTSIKYIFRVITTTKYDCKQINLRICYNIKYQIGYILETCHVYTNTIVSVFFFEFDFFKIKPCTDSKYV